MKDLIANDLMLIKENRDLQWRLRLRNFLLIMLTAAFVVIAFFNRNIYQRGYQKGQDDLIRHVTSMRMRSHG